MSQRLISLNEDLRRLRDEGYDVSVRANHLVIGRVPYVDSNKRIRFGTLVSELTLAGDDTRAPGTHVALFAGEYPCRSDGSPIETIRNQSGRRDLGDGLVIDHAFSSKPQSGYSDHYEKMVTYVNIIATQAIHLDASVTATPFPAIPEESDDSVFEYIDTAASRSGINDLSEKLSAERIAIIGLGGTGSYVLDLVAKTTAREIHLFDGDVFSQHNAFRAPGAASIEDLRREPHKVDYFAERYAAMRSGIVKHDCYLDDLTVEQLDGMTFAFLCLGDGGAKRTIVEALEARNTPFIDVGLGLLRAPDGSLHGVLRVTTSTPDQRSHVHEKHRIAFSGGALPDEYSTNIQIADLNALNATLAVVKWKKLRGVYLDLEREHFSTYTIDGNEMTNEDKT